MIIYIKFPYAHLIKRSDLKTISNRVRYFLCYSKMHKLSENYWFLPLINKFNYFIKINNYLWSTNICIATCYRVPPSILIRICIYCKKKKMHAGSQRFSLTCLLIKIMFFFFSHAIIVQRFWNSYNYHFLSLYFAFFLKKKYQRSCYKLNSFCKYGNRGVIWHIYVCSY